MAAGSSPSAEAGSNARSPRKTRWPFASTNRARFPPPRSCAPWTKIQHHRSDHPRVLHGRNVKVGQLEQPVLRLRAIIDAESGEELVKAGAQIGEALNKIQASGLKSVECVTKVTDPLILNTLAEDTPTSHEDALMRIYARLRPGNPPQLEKAQTLFH
jgi:hypothetical protein